MKDTIIKDKPSKVKFGEVDMTKNDNDLTPIEFIEKHYPETSKEFKMIQEEQYETLWKMFVESPESIDNRTWSFINFTTEIESERKKKYAEKLATFKCLYQVGMFEGINGQKILW